MPDGQAEIIACEGNFAGRTITLSASAPSRSTGTALARITPGFKLIPYGDADALEAAITPNTVAFIVEPIQGEGGVIVPPEGYLRKVRDLCTKHNVLLIADEIQTGLGRTGKLFACDHEGVRPDMVTIGKALSGGFYPVSAVLSRREVLGVFAPGEHGSTFGGNPLACAVGREALRVLVEEDMIENAATMGEYFMERLAEINSPHVKEVRGRGPADRRRTQAGGGRRAPLLRGAAGTSGILAKETHVNTIRFAPPLVITARILTGRWSGSGPVMMMKYCDLVNTCLSVFFTALFLVTTYF